MRRATAIAVLLLVILGGIAIGIGAYHAGVNHGLSEARNASQIVRVEDRGFGFGFILFPLLFFFLIFALLRGAFWGRRWGGPGHRHWGVDHGESGPPPAFEEWHRRQHEETPRTTAGTGGEPASV